MTKDMKDEETPYAQFKLNLPSALRAIIGTAAEANGRSVTAEIVHRIAASGDEDIRDRLAGHAVAGLLSNPNCRPVGKDQARGNADIAAKAYTVADAMLKAREDRS